MTKYPQLKVKKRKIFGKKVKHLRREGVLPANIYGKNVKSLAIEVGLLGFEKLKSRVGETEILDLEVADEKKARPVLIHNLQIDPVSGKPLHVDFLQVDLTEKVTIAVPVKLVGEAPAVKEGRGVLLELKNELEVEALPEDLPLEFEADVANLSQINDAILVKDLKLPKGVEVKVDPEELICKIESQQVEAEEKKKVEEEVVEAPKEGEEKKEEKEEGKKKEKPENS